MATRETENGNTADVLNKLSAALARGDPVASLRTEIQTQFHAIETHFDAIEKATELQHQDMVRVPTQVDRAVDGLRGLIDVQLVSINNDLKGVKDVIAELPDLRKDQVQHLREFLEARLATSVAELYGRIEKLKGETDERFSGVAAQFSERDTRTDQRAGDTKLAVDAAFAAAKEATAKIEAGFTKQIEAMISTIDTKTANLAGGISDLKDRMTALESRTAERDPSTAIALASLTAEMKVLQHQRDNAAGATQGSNQIWGVIAVVIAVVISGAGLFVAMSHSTPQVVYPAPK